MIKKINILTGCLLFVFSTIASAADVFFSEQKIKTRIGDKFSLDVLMSDFSAAEGGGLVLHFNSDVVRVTNVTVDNNVWNFASRNGDIDNDNGTVSDILFANYQGVAGSAKIASIEFESIKKGGSRITLEESAVNPFASGGEKIDVTFESTNIHVRR